MKRNRAWFLWFQSATKDGEVPRSPRSAELIDLIDRDAPGCSAGSALPTKDEAGTLRYIAAHLNLFHPAIAQYYGRFVNSSDDSAPAFFRAMVRNRSARS